MGMGGKEERGGVQRGRTLTGLRGLAGAQAAESEVRRFLSPSGQEISTSSRGRSLGGRGTRGLAGGVAGGIRGRGNPALKRFRRGE